MLFISVGAVRALLCQEFRNDRQYHVRAVSGLTDGARSAARINVVITGLTGSCRACIH